MTTHGAWFQDLIGEDTKSAAAEKSKVSTSTLTHQLRQDHLSAPTVIALARAYGRPVVRALAETGHITPDEASLIPIDQALQIAPDRKMIGEMARRLKLLSPDIQDMSLDDVASINDLPPHESPLSDGATVSQFPRSPHSESEDSESESLVRGVDYVADQSDTEPEEGDDDFHDGP